MTTHTNHRVRILFAGMIGVMGVLFALGFIIQGRAIYVLTLGMIYASVAVGLDLIAGYGGRLVLGNFAFVAIGAYGSTIFSTFFGIGFVSMFMVAILLSAAIALLVGYPVLKLPLLSVALVTFFFAFVTVVLLNGQLLSPWAHAANGLGVPAMGEIVSSDLGLYLFAWAYLLVVALLTSFYAMSRTGHALRLIKTDKTIADSLGIRTDGVLLGAFVYSAAVAGGAGVIYGQAVQFISPEGFDPLESVHLIEMMVLGGMGTIVGPIVGSIGFTWIDNLARAAGTWREVITALIFLCILVFAPRGVVGELMHWYQGRTRRHYRRATDETEISEDDGPSVGREGAAMPASDRVVLALNRVSVSYGEVRALSDVSLEVHGGEIHALIGPNGAGKTTLLNCISGIQSVTSGEIVLDGNRIDGLKARLVRRAGVTRTFQHLALAPDLTTYENIFLGDLERKRLQRPREASVAADAQLENREGAANRLLGMLGIESNRALELAESLTSSEQKLADICRAVLPASNLVIMDEPTAGLAADQIQRVVALIREIRAQRRIAIVVIAHHIGFIRDIADSVTVLDFGRVIARGRPEEVIRDPLVTRAFVGGYDAAEH